MFGRFEGFKYLADISFLILLLVSTAIYNIHVLVAVCLDCNILCLLQLNISLEGLQIYKAINHTVHNLLIYCDNYNKNHRDLQFPILD